MLSKKRNGEIDVLRFLFSLCILFYHFQKKKVLPFMDLFPDGNIGVEFFFIVSGYLMARHAEHRSKSGGIADETALYIKQRYRSFFRYYIVAFLLHGFIRYIMIRKVDIIWLIPNLLKTVPTVLLAFVTLNPSSAALTVPATWFLSALLIASFILYPVLLRNVYLAEVIILPLLSLFTLSYLYNTCHTVIGVTKWMGFASFGALRAVGEMALGACLCVPTDVLSRNDWSEKPVGKLLVTAFKVFCYLVVLAYAHGKIGIIKLGSDFSLHALLFCAIGVMLSFSSIGYSIPDSSLTRYLGKISLPLFIFHYAIIATWIDYLGTGAVSLKYAAFMACVTLVASVFLMYLTEWITSSFTRRRNKAHIAV